MIIRQRSFRIIPQAKHKDSVRNLEDELLEMDKMTPDQPSSLNPEGKPEREIAKILGLVDSSDEDDVGKEVRHYLIHHPESTPNLVRIPSE
jgi:hypothetical protein